MIMGAYCVGKVNNMLSRLYYDNGRIFCVGKVHNMSPL